MLDDMFLQLNVHFLLSTRSIVCRSHCSLERLNARTLINKTLGTLDIELLRGSIPDIKIKSLWTDTHWSNQVKIFLTDNCISGSVRFMFAKLLALTVHKLLIYIYNIRIFGIIWVISNCYSKSIVFMYIQKISWDCFASQLQGFLARRGIRLISISSLNFKSLGTM